ncbi:MAG: MlaD family protein [Bryobacteraceae bacterium]
MPIEKRAKWAQLKVGIMALVALIILAVLIFLLTGSQSLFASRFTLYTYMEDSAALAEGSPVRLNGILVGKVEKIALSGSKEPKRLVRLDMKIDEKFIKSIPSDSVASIGAENLLGTKYINIKSGKSTATVKPGQELASLDTADFEALVQQGYPLLTSLQDILTKVNAIVGQVEVGKGSIGKLLVDEELYDRLLSITNEAQKITEALNSGKGTAGKLIYDDQLYNDVRGSIARLDTLMDGLQQGQGTAGKLLKDPALYDDVRQTIGQVRTLLADLNAGKGTVGKLLKSDDLNNRIQATIARLDKTIDRVNSGEGTIGQLLVNPALYDSMNGATKELHGLLQDFRRDPKKFLRIKLSLF